MSTVTIPIRTPLMHEANLPREEPWPRLIVEYYGDNSEVPGTRIEYPKLPRMDRIMRCGND